MNSEKNSKVSFFCGLLAGSAIGAAVAILLAPDSGTNTRSVIKGRANTYKDRLSNLATEYRERIATLSEEYKDKLADLRSEMHDRFAAQHSVQEEIDAAEDDVAESEGVLDDEEKTIEQEESLS